MLTKEELNEVLSTLRTLVLINKTYKALYLTAFNTKSLTGSNYKQIDEDGIPRLTHVLNEKYLSPKDKITVFTHLNRLTQDFSVLSALSAEDWENLAESLAVCHARIVDPDNTISAKIRLDNIKPTIQLMLNDPWIITLLLLEILYINH